MGEFLDRILRDKEFWDEFSSLLYQATSGDPKFKTGAALYFDEPPGATARSILKKQGVPETSVFSDYIRRFGGFPNRPEVHEAIKSMVWALYGPPAGLKVDSSRQSLSEAEGQSLLTRSWIASALGAPSGFPMVVPMSVARTGAAAGELLHRYLSGQGSPGAASMALSRIYSGAETDPVAAASLIISAIQIAGAGVYSYDTLQMMERMVYEALDSYREARFNELIGPDANFIEYLLSHAAYWLNTYFPGIDTATLLAQIDQFERSLQGSQQQGQPQPRPAPAPSPAPPPSQAADWTMFESPPAPDVTQAQAAVAEAKKTWLKEPEPPSGTLPPPSYDPKYFETSTQLFYAKGPDNDYRIFQQSWDNAFKTWEVYFKDPKAASPWIPVQVKVDEFIELYDGWRRANRLPSLSPEERNLIRSHYSIGLR